MSAFELYWRFLGLPLSRAKGALVDAVPFSVVEVSLWVAAAATAAWALSWILPRGLPFSRPLRVAAFVLGPVFLVLLALGQGAFPFSLAPSALRRPLPEVIAADSLDEASFRDWVARREARLREALDDEVTWVAFQRLPEKEALRLCDRSLDSVLDELDLTPGRRVRTFKTMGPWTTALGLIYGGPAFHDPFFGEIGIISDEEYPAPHYWRLIAACHEAAHAKGFTREMDAEILTQAALLRSGDSLLQSVADIHFLRKAGIPIEWPRNLIGEAERIQRYRVLTERNRPVVAFLREWLRRRDLRNSPRKYGERDHGERWDPRHPFFASVRAAGERLGLAEEGAHGP